MIEVGIKVTTDEHFETDPNGVSAVSVDGKTVRFNGEAGGRTSSNSMPHPDGDIAREVMAQVLIEQVSRIIGDVLEVNVTQAMATALLERLEATPLAEASAIVMELRRNY